MIYSYFEHERKLLYHDHDADDIPEELINEFGNKDVSQIDFSSNSLVSIDFISCFRNLTEVVLDNNLLSDATIFPSKIFFQIQLLSLNNNKFEDLHKLLYNICYSFPNLRHLSLLGNPLCLALNENFNEDDHQNYRLFIISRMPKLKFLDAKVITNTEWQMIHSSVLSHENSSAQKERNERVSKLNFFDKFFRTPSKEVESVDEVDRGTPLPKELNFAQPAPRSSYSRLKQFYQGKESQGNRFISNKML